MVALEEDVWAEGCEAVEKRMFVGGRVCRSIVSWQTHLGHRQILERP